MRKILLFSMFFILVFVLFNGVQTAADRITGKHFGTRSEVIATEGMVAASHPLAAQIGIDILKKGGNAVDAAIAVNAALGLMEPTGSGIGGDLFAIVWDAKTGKMHGLNASGYSPAALNLEILKKKGLKRMPFYGPLPWTVPGCVSGWFSLHDRFGKLKFRDILAPAIRYAENGFPLTELIAYYWKRSVDRFKEYENFQTTYAPGGKSPEKGELFRNPDLAKTYRLIARKGRDAFYKGEISERMVAYSKKKGGYFSLQDFSEFKSEWVEPMGVEFMGHTLWELPPNGQGLAALQILNMLKGMDLKGMGHNSAQYLHTLIEMKKIVYEDRAKFYADPAFSGIDYTAFLTEKYTKERLRLFHPKRASRKLKVNSEPPEKGDTVYLTVVDKDRNVVSLIQSNYYGFGSGMVPDGLGFCIQDRGSLFSLDKDHVNVFEPRKRPFHTIIPAMVTREGKPVFSFGVMGGSMQPQGHVQVLLNILVFGMNVQEAGDAARFRHGGSSQPDYGVMTDGGTVFLESGVLPGVIRDLLSQGHRVSRTRGGYGGYQGIWIDRQKGVLIGGSESRKDGAAMGY